MQSGPGRTIGVDAWKRAWLNVRTVEPNNNLLNLIAKARKPKCQVFLDLPCLLKRYKKYLERLKARGIDPWKDRSRRSDMHNMSITEAAGHFHLYAWLQEAVDGVCVAGPEFPTGAGKVDLHP